MISLVISLLKGIKTDHSTVGIREYRKLQQMRNQLSRIDGYSSTTHIGSFALLIWQKMSEDAPAAHSNLIQPLSTQERV